ncbi:restriction endonuclease subunit S [Marinobacter salicampi]|uniref:restriction endonuclease subunit S n=1 Tax=Marinobacter salicampi TaxID=435907 RepID=UPI00140E6C0E|nr:restriction endonuclease subunit S [Marinobacter salicampi]
MDHFELPPEWCLTDIESILAPQSDGKLVHQGWSPQCDKVPAEQGEWGVLKTTAIQDGYFLEDENKRLPEGKEPKPRIEVKAGDLLVTNAGPRARCGVICLVNKVRPKLMISGKMYRLRFPHERISPQFIESWLRTSFAQKELNDRKTGISESGLNMTQTRFLTLPIVVAPTEEQKIIADKLDTLLAQVENTKARLERIPQILKRFRQSVLAAAVSGRLTEDFSADDHDYYQTLDLEIARDKKLAKIQPPTKDEIDLANEMFESPDWADWKLYALEQLIESARGIPYGIVQTGDAQDEGIPTIRCGDVKPLRIETGSLKKVLPSIEEKYARTRLSGGEVVLAIRGTVGNAAVIPRGLAAHPLNISREVAMVPVRKNILPEYVALLLQSPGGYRALAEKTRGVAQRGINLADVKRLVTPLPTKSEQTEVVARVGQLFAHADRIEQQVNNALARVNNLTQSILGKAFRGELSEQWRKDNPDLVTGGNSAQALLESIKVKRTKSGTNKEKRGCT